MANGSCEAMADTIADPGAALDGDRLIELLETIDEPAASRLRRFYGATDTDLEQYFTNPVQYEKDFMDAYNAADDVTFAACEIPLITAELVTMAGTSLVHSCAFDTRSEELSASTDESDTCPEEEYFGPRNLPCFSGPDASQDRFGTRYKAVDCDTGETVSWDYDTNKWLSGEVQSLEEFRATSNP